jgi:hypothetical protein
LLQVDEPSCLVEIDNLLKDLATCDVMPFEEKGVQPFSLKVLSNFVVSSNDDGLVKIADGERRWVALKCNKAHKDDHRYFRDLRDSIDNPEGLRSIYQGLMERDISRIYNMQAERVLTDYYMQCRALFLSPLLSFLSALYKRQIKQRQTFGAPVETKIATGTGGAPAEANTSPEVDELERKPKRAKIAPGTGGVPAEADTQPEDDEFGSEHLRRLFSEFLETTRLGDPRGWNQRVFGDKMGEHVEIFKKRNSEVHNADAMGSGITKNESAAGNVYAFNFDQLKKYLDSKNFFDQNAEISVMPDPQQPSQTGGLDARRKTPFNKNAEEMPDPQQPSKRGGVDAGRKKLFNENAENSVMSDPKIVNFFNKNAENSVMPDPQQPSKNREVEQKG